MKNAMVLFVALLGFSAVASATSIQTEEYFKLYRQAGVTPDPSCDIYTRASVGNKSLYGSTAMVILQREVSGTCEIMVDSEPREYRIVTDRRNLSDGVGGLYRLIQATSVAGTVYIWDLRESKLPSSSTGSPIIVEEWRKNQNSTYFYGAPDVAQVASCDTRAGQAALSIAQLNGNHLAQVMGVTALAKTNAEHLFQVEIQGEDLYHVNTSPNCEVRGVNKVLGIVPGPIYGNQPHIDLNEPGTH